MTEPAITRALAVDEGRPDFLAPAVAVPSGEGSR